MSAMKRNKIVEIQWKSLWERSNHTNENETDESKKRYKINVYRALKFTVSNDVRCEWEQEKRGKTLKIYIMRADMMARGSW